MTDAGERLKKILKVDKQTNPRAILLSVSQDIKNVMENYVDFGEKNGVYTEFSITSRGLEFDIKVVCERVKELRIS